MMLAIIFEIIVGISAGNANGFKQFWWTTITLVSGIIATYFLSLSLLTFDVGVGYAIWTSFSGIGICFFGVICFKKRLNIKKLIGILIIIIGVIGLRIC
ncbi:DMT family transporter [Morganella morganii]|uniref:DMT family transporter n=1 Tax=Morganella morganii TaxID=582 RepID=UPI0018D38832|nr:SMR family transporter [Morganella morganii]